MKRIFLFENSFAPHETSLVTAIKLFKEVNYEVILCVNNKSLNRLKNLFDLSNVQYINISNLKGWITFFKLLRKDDYVFFNTILLRNIWSVVLVAILSKNNIFYIRNMNSWFYEPEMKKLSLKNKILSKILFLSKRFLINKAKLFAVGNYNIKNNLSKKVKKEIVVFPFNLFHESNICMSNNKIFTFVIPGNIDLKRKRLDIIRDATLLFNKYDLEKFRIILLGRPINKKDEEFVKDWKKKLGNSLVYYNSFISDEEFDRVLKNADVIMGVLNVNYKDKYGNKEIYGQTKDTGIEAHAIAYAKPLFVNSEYEVDKFLKNTTIKFMNIVDCKNKMELFFEKKIKIMPEECIKVSKKYSLEYLANNLKGIL